MNSTNSPLRTLALKVAYGEITPQSYQQSRRKLLTAITNGELSPHEMTHSTDHFNLKGRNNRWRGLALITILTVGVAAIAYTLLRQPQGITQQTGTDGGNPVNNVTAQRVTPAEQAMLALLESSVWSEERIGEFLAIWRTLGSDDRSALRSGLTYKRVRDQTSMKIKEIEALSDVGSTDTDSNLLEALQRLDKTLR